MNVKILDCTLRDGGYYTNWDFSRQLVDKYIEAVSELPIDYIEIGYRSPVKNIYLGEYYYTPIETINRIREQLISSIKIAIMINTKDIKDVVELEDLLNECKEKIDLVRFAVASNNIKKATTFAEKAKELGYEVALNLMYLSQKSSKEITHEIDFITNQVKDIDFIYLVDSYGSCLPSEIKEKFSTIRKENNNIALGFHGHDNIQLAYANTLEAINAGVSIIDSTITGMGRGAGNLSTELICSYMSSNRHINLDYTNLVELVEKFNELKSEYGWGTSLPYMISGFNKLPQGEVMDLISLKRFSTNSIVKIIKNKIYDEVKEDSTSKFKDLSNKTFKCDVYNLTVLIGGGSSVLQHIDGLKTLNKKFKILFIHSSTKHLNLFLRDEDEFNNLVCLPGDEHKKINFNNIEKDNLSFVISKDTEVNNSLINFNCYSMSESLDTQLENRLFAKDAPLLMGMKVIDILNINNFFVVGFDGYDSDTQTNKILREENQTIIDEYSKLNKNLVSLTPSKYNIEVNSLYSIIVNGMNK